MDRATHMKAAEQLVPNAGMLVHQGALPHGMRTELVNFGKAKEMLSLWGRDRWVSDANLGPKPGGGEQGGAGEKSGAAKEQSDGG